MFAQPLSLPSAHSDPLYGTLIPSIPDLSTPQLAWSAQGSEKAPPLAATTKITRSTRLHHQRRSKSVLKSTSNTIFGRWDIPVKSEARLHSKTKGKVGANGGAHRGAAAMETTHTPNAGAPAHTFPPAASIVRDHAPESHKTSPLAFKTLRRMPSANLLASNATTSWTIGQQNSSSRNNRAQPTPPSPSSPSPPASPSSVQNFTTISANAAPSASSQSREVESPSDSSTRSKFLRAFGKFKSKHLSQKRANASAHTDAHANDAGTGVSITSNNSTGSNNNATSASNSSSFVLPLMHFNNDVSLNSVEQQQGSSATPGHSDAASVSMRSYVEPTSSKENTEQLQDIDMGDYEAASHPQLHHDRSASSSLRVKFKNRVHTTLASIKSSSNLREKAQSQAAASSFSSPNSPSHTSDQPELQQQLQSSSVSIASDSHRNSAMLRLSKPFWTFPRVRPESSSSSKLMPWGSSSRPSSFAEKLPHTKPQHAEPDAAMISPEPGPSTQPTVEAVDSEDESIDIIMPGDYDDYTQFAELPLKKRKKLLAAAAAAAATAATNAGRPSQESSGKRPHTMKRLLLPQKTVAVERETGRAGENNPVTDEPGTTNGQLVPQRNSRKRPKDQDSIEQKQRQEPNKMARSNSHEPSEWRKAIMKSLHIGRGNQTSRKNKGSSTEVQLPSEPTIETTIKHKGVILPRELSHPSQRDSGVYPGEQSARPKRSESNGSVRSRSMATSSHAALLATTLPKPTNPGSQRETLEMAMRRRRRSSAVRSIFMDPETSRPLPRPQPFFDDDAASTHVTHTFTSFTLELADVHHAHAVVNNSVVPGLFNFKRQPRLTMSSMNNMDTDHEFKGFDSDGDAMSGYTGDADVSMEEIFVRPRTPIARNYEGRDKGKARESGPSDIAMRRKMSTGEVDSDTLPELPILSIRTRDLNRSSSGGRGTSGYNKDSDTNGRESPRSPRRQSPTLHRKTSRNFLSEPPVAVGISPATTVTPSPSRHSTSQISMDDVVSWKPRNVLQQSQSRPSVPALNTKPVPAARGAGVPSSTLITSSRTPNSALSAILTQSPGYQSPTGAARHDHEMLRHHRQQSSAFSGHHQQHTSGDTLLPNHLKNFSNASTMSASSGYSAQTLNGNSPLTFQPKEFSANQDYLATTPVDLKVMDFETLLKTAEREQQKGQVERTLKKKKSFQFQNSKPLKIHHGGSNDRHNVENYLNGNSLYRNLSPITTKSALSALVASASNQEESRARGSDASYYSNGSPQHSPPNSIQHSRSHSSNVGKFSGLQVQTNRVEQRPPSQGHPRVPLSKSAISFELAESTAMANAGDRNIPRSKRVMKKKTSVIKLSGNVQGRREDDGMIRVSVTPSPDPRQWRAS